MSFQNGQEKTEKSKVRFQPLRTITIMDSGDGFSFPVKSKLLATDEGSSCSKLSENNISADSVQMGHPALQPIALQQSISKNLLFEALLDVMCKLVEPNDDKRKLLVKVLHDWLGTMKVILPISNSKNTEPLRSYFMSSFESMIRQAQCYIEGTPKNFYNHELPSAGIRYRSCSPSEPSLLSLLRKSLQCISGIQNDTHYMNKLYQRSRYKSEFLEISHIGTGGFGTVYQAINKLDGRAYAIKKIPIKCKTNQLPEFIKVIREVQLLASFHHINIVGYHTAWIDYLDSECMVTSSSDGTSPSKSKIHEISASENFGSKIKEPSITEEDSFIKFETSKDFMSTENSVQYKTKDIKIHHNEPIRNRNLLFRSISHDGRYKGFEKFYYNSVKSSDSKEEKYSKSKEFRHSSAEHYSKALVQYSKIEHSLSKKHLQYNKLLPCQSSFYGSLSPKSQLVLLIQMELCAENLQVWLQRRNKTSVHIAFGDYENFIFQEILHGVEYFHSQNIVHRDLKPSNIFLNQHDHHIKIGDFGLAKFEINESDNLDFVVAPASGKSGNTSGVGTRIYASPEQLKSSIYDQKSDMYSLGIILTELFHPFNTEMERAKCLSAVRKGQIPEVLRTCWPLQAKLINQLTLKNPVERPSAKAVLKSLFPEKQCDELHRLEKELTLVKEENKSLRISLSSDSDLYERSLSYEDSKVFDGSSDNKSKSYIQEIKLLKQQLFAKEEELKQKDEIIKELENYIKNSNLR